MLDHRTAMRARLSRARRFGAESSDNAGSALLLTLPGHELDWQAATEYIESSIPLEALHTLAQWFVLSEADTTDELGLTARGLARLRLSLREALRELRAAIEATKPYDCGPWSEAERRTIGGADVLIGRDTHADKSLTDIYTAIHYLDCGGVLEVLKIRREA
jgi:hypothetical protein